MLPQKQHISHKCPGTVFYGQSAGYVHPRWVIIKIKQLCNPGDFWLLQFEAFKMGLHAMQLLGPAIMPHLYYVPIKHDYVYKAQKTLNEWKRKLV